MLSALLYLRNCNYLSVFIGATPPRVTLAKIALECKLVKTESLVIDVDIISSEVESGHVIGIYISDSIIEDGKVSVGNLKPISILGFDEHASIDNIFRMKRD
jgi:hypothetical protein